MRRYSYSELNALFDDAEQKNQLLNCFISFDREHALHRAEQMQKQMESGESTGPLDGVPIAIKDNIVTKGLRTTCGSKMLSNFVPAYDAEVVTRLERAGAIVMGKTNMDEFAMGNTNETSYFGTVKNPYNHGCVPGGSSGGSAAAVAAGLCQFALGSDTGGSIRQPASHCGVVGMKPTYGSVSRYGLVAFASSLEQIGPITKNVTDCATVLDVIAGHDPKDSTSACWDYVNHKIYGYTQKKCDANIEKGQRYTEALVNDVRGMKIGIPKGYFKEGLNCEVRKAIKDAIEVLADCGAEIEEFELPYVDYAVATYYVLSCAEASSNLARFEGVKYGHRGQNYDGLHQMYKYTRTEGFGSEVKHRIMMGSFVLSSGYYDAYYMKALRAKALIKQAFDEAFQKYDVIVAPTAPTTAGLIGAPPAHPLEKYLSDIYTVPGNLAGLPAISIPCGKDSKGLPIGLQIMGNCFEEHKVLQVAYTYECNKKDSECATINFERNVTSNCDAGEVTANV